ncbi:MAG TPA: DMT family transporter [Gemmatimonadaceae bacterium]|nr:DMT family transporter [Gemmatimonadaceae bacterium]
MTVPHDTSAPAPRVPGAGFVLALALLGISTAGPLVRLSSAHPVTIAAWRVGFSLIVIAAAIVVTKGWKQWRRLDRGGLLLAVAAGIMLALHFWSWNASVALTTIAASAVLVNLHPIIVAAISSVWLHERPTRRQWIGIGVAMLGALVVGAADLGTLRESASGRALLGDGLALIGAFTVAIYYLIGRRLRQTLDLWPYVGLVYSACLLTLLLIASIAGAPLAPQPPRELLIFAALALGPMLLGHTGMNWALRYLPAYVVTLTVLGEPVGATLLALLLPGIREVPPVLTIAGGILVLLGIMLAMARVSRASRASRAPSAA